jgi:hypothetical protein
VWINRLGPIARIDDLEPVAVPFHFFKQPPNVRFVECGGWRYRSHICVLARIKPRFAPMYLDKMHLVMKTVIRAN